MNLFTKSIEPTQETIDKRARQLIENQFCRSISLYSSYSSPPAAEKYAQELLNKAIESTVIKDKIDDFLATELFKEIVKQEMIDNIRSILREDLITELVEKINSVQVRK